MTSLTMNDSHTIPALGYGTWRISDKDSPPLVLEALAAGYRHIDTAALYDNEAGVGRGIRDSGLHRSEVFVTTKLWNTDHADPRSALSRSLDKLGLDHVDLYLIHWPVPAQNRFVHAWDKLIELREEGLATSIGVSNFLPEHVAALAPTGVVPAVNQIELHPSFANRASEADNTERGILTECYAPLGRTRDFAGTVADIAARRGATPAQVVIAWHLAHGRVLIPKSATPARIRENYAGGATTLTEADVAAIDKLDAGNRICGHPATFSG